MWAITEVLFLSAVIVFSEVPRLLKNNLRKEFGVFIVLLFIGTTLSITKSLRVQIPNPLDFITFVYQPISNMIFKVLK